MKAATCLIPKHQFLQACLAHSSGPPTGLPRGKQAGSLLHTKLAHSSGPPTGLASLPSSESEWTEVVVLADRHGVTPMLYEPLTQGECPPAVPEPVLQTLLEAWLMNGAKNALLYHDLAPVLRALQQENIPVIVLKGAHLAASVYPNMALRAMNDIDLLVPANDLEKTAAKLRDLGYLPDAKVIDSTPWNERCHLPRRYGPPPGPEFEIHWTLAPPAQFPNLAAAGLFERSRPATIAGLETRVLSPEDLLLHLCLHTASDGHRCFRLGLRPLCDIAAAVRSYHQELDWRQLQSRAVQWRAERCVYLALWLARQLLAAPIPDAVLRSFGPQDPDDSWAEVAVNQVLLGGAQGLSPQAAVASRPLKALVTWGAAEPGRGTLGVLLKALVPSRQYMAKYLTEHRRVPPNSAPTCFCYLTRALDLLGRGARAAWRWRLHRREALADAQRFRQQTRLWNWMMSPQRNR